MHHKIWPAFFFSLASLIVILLCLSGRSNQQKFSLFTVITSDVNSHYIGHASTPEGLRKAWIESEGTSNEVGEGIRYPGLHDFYSAYLFGYCKGFYPLNANNTWNWRAQVTYCCPQMYNYHFDLPMIIRDELSDGVSLDDIGWPAAINEATRRVEDLSSPMNFLYIVGAVTIGLGCIGTFCGLFFPDSWRGWSGLSAMTLLLTANVCFLIASAFATRTTIVLVNAINKYGKNMGLVAWKGKTFIGMSWLAWILNLGAIYLWLHEVAWVFVVCQYHEI